MRLSTITACCLLLTVAACKKREDRIVYPFNVARDTYALPGDTLFPEGITFHARSGYFYTGSVTNGDILRVNVNTGEVQTLAPGVAHNRKAATGMKIDAQDRLWVCGGADNKIQVLDLNGILGQSWDMAALFNAGFINDCIMDRNYAYFTDSRVQQIYRIDLNNYYASAGPEVWLTFTNAQIPYSPTGTNANGIEQTEDGRYLIMVVSSSGKLYRIGKADKSITEITLNTPVTSGDGLYLEGSRLYVSRNATGQIFPVDLTNDFTQGTVGAGFGGPLRFNTTLTRAGDYFLVVNGQLDKRGTNAQLLPFTVSRVDIL